MAKLPEQDRDRMHRQCMRDGRNVPSWTTAQLRAAFNVLDGGPADDNVGGAEDLVILVANGLGIGALAAARNLLTMPGMYALMSLPPFRTAIADLQTAAETAAGASFTVPGETGPLGASMGRKRFADLLAIVIRRRLPSDSDDFYRAEEDANG